MNSLPLHQQQHFVVVVVLLLFYKETVQCDGKEQRTGSILLGVRAQEIKPANIFKG